MSTPNYSTGPYIQKSEYDLDREYEAEQRALDLMDDLVEDMDKKERKALKLLDQVVEKTYTRVVSEYEFIPGSVQPQPNRNGNIVYMNPSSPTPHSQMGIVTPPAATMSPANNNYGGSPQMRSNPASPSTSSYGQSPQISPAVRLLEVAIARGETDKSESVLRDEKNSLDLRRECISKHHANRLLDLAILRGETDKNSVLHGEKSHFDMARERDAQAQALQLMSMAVRSNNVERRPAQTQPRGIDSRPAPARQQETRRRNVDLQDEKKALDLRREMISKTNANKLLDKAMQRGELNKNSALHNEKSHLDLMRERASQAQALQLVNTTAQNKPNANDYRRATTGEQRRHGGATNQHAWAAPRSIEEMAVSSRKKKDPTPDDVLDPESVSGMKCRQDLEREAFAKNRALKLLDEGHLLSLNNVKTQSSTKRGLSRALGFY